MSSESTPLSLDPAYLTRREAQERLAAEQSLDLSVRRVHEVLADHYAERLRITLRPAA